VLPRLGIVAGLIACALVIGVAACQVFAVGGAMARLLPATAVPVPTAPQTPLVSANMVVWGKVPYCT
jgi:hypothetical protein